MPALWIRPLLAFLCVFVVYQTAEGLQTRWAVGGVVGPSLMLLAALLPWPLGYWLGGRGFAAFGLGATGKNASLLSGGMLLAGLAKLASLAAGLGLGILTTAEDPATLTPAMVAVAALTTFVPSLAEDILTRGFLLRVFPLRLGFWSFTVASALLYTLNHIWRLDWGGAEQLRLFCLGLAYGAAAWRAGSLWGAVALHWGWNLSNALAEHALPFEAVSQTGARYLSAAAHLVILAIVLAWLRTDRNAAATASRPPPRASVTSS